MPTAMFGRFPEPLRPNNTIAADDAWHNREAPRLELESLGGLGSSPMLVITGLLL